MTVWNDRKISEWAQSGGVTPFDAACVNPASLDLRLGNKIRFPKTRWFEKYKKMPITMRTPASELWDEEIEFDEIIIPAHGVALCCSLEYVTMPPDACGTLMSKSSTGRRLFEHLHSGFFDPDFHGQATFEFINDGPWDIKLSVGDRLVQLKIEQLVELPEKSYLETGRYNGQVGPTPARAEKA